MPALRSGVFAARGLALLRCRLLHLGHGRGWHLQARHLGLPHHLRLGRQRHGGAFWQGSAAGQLRHAQLGLTPELLALFIALAPPGHLGLGLRLGLDLRLWLNLT